MKDVIKKYDQFLVLIKKLDGSKELRRKSQFYKTISFPVLEITNQYLGSCRWVITRLQKMDSRHIDLISKGIIDGMNRRKWKKQDDRLSREIATFIQEWDKMVI